MAIKQTVTQLQRLIQQWVRKMEPVGADERALTRHADKVGRIARQLRERTGHAPLSLRKKSVSHQVPKAASLKLVNERLDIGDLD